MEQGNWFRAYRVGALAIAGCILLSLMGCWSVGVAENSAIASPSSSVTASGPASGPVVTAPIAQAPPRKPSPSAPMRRAPMDTKVNPKLIAANTRFGFKLFSEIVKSEPGKNVFVSPSSVAIALAMTYNGAGGTTQQAMAKALDLQGMTLTDLNQANADLKGLLETPEAKVQLAIANSLWARQGVDFKSQFLERNRKFYAAKITDLDFRDPKAPTAINNWVKEQTQGKISQIVDDLSPNDVLFLVNAIYFKGAWTREFDPKATQPKPFYLLNGQSKSHPMMAQSGEYRYSETDAFQAVALPYGEQRRMSLYLFLPKPNSTLATFQKTLTADNWQTWMGGFRRRSGSIQVPRFKLEYGVELRKVLSTLGMGVAFNPNQANFTGLSSVATYISDVKHKTFVEVNEEGTEAAATTSVGIRTTSVPVDPPFNLVIDRPFFCAIRDNQTGTVLFMGTIVEPK
jgi:serine protease inhibitor